MQKIIEKFKRILQSIERKNISIHSFLLTFLGIISARLLIVKILTESWANDFTKQKDQWFFYEFSHTFLFFLLTFLIFLFILTKTLKITTKKASVPLLFGLLIILTPPIGDHIISKGKGFWSFYEFDGLPTIMTHFFNFFNNTPGVGITYGVKIGIFISLLLTFSYSLFRTKKIGRSLSITLAAYFAFFILGTLPSWIAIIVKGPSLGFFNVSQAHIAQMFLAPPKIFSRNMGDMISALNIKMSIVLSVMILPALLLSFYSEYKEKIKSFLKGIRPAQIIFHCGTALFGMTLAIIFTNKNLGLHFFDVIATILLLQSITLAWITSVIVNDIFDQKIDTLSNPNRPLILKKFSKEEYQKIGILTFVGCIFSAYIIDPRIAMLMIAYQGLAWIYSAPPFRLKKFAIISTLTSALALISIFISGFILASSSQDISNIPQSIIWLILIAFTVSLPIKDLKDIKGDQADKVYTIPVIFGEYWGKIIIASGIFLSFFLSIFFLKEFSLLPWAIIFGSASFWMILYSNKLRFVTHRNIIWWIMLLLLGYTIVLILSL